MACKAINAKTEETFPEMEIRKAEKAWYDLQNLKKDFESSRKRSMIFEEFIGRPTEEKTRI